MRGCFTLEGRKQKHPNRKDVQGVKTAQIQFSWELTIICMIMGQILDIFHNINTDFCDVEQWAAAVLAAIPKLDASHLKTSKELLWKQAL